MNRSNPIYTITVNYEETWACVGFTYNKQDAINLVLMNAGDIHACNGKYVVIECVSEGIYQLDRDEMWFNWIGNSDIGSYVQCTKPVELSKIINFSMG